MSAGTRPFSLARFYVVHVGIAVLAAALLLCVFELTDLDVAFTDLFYDAERRRFPLRKERWIELLFHDGVKIPIVVGGALCAVGFLASFFVARLGAQRRALLLVALTVALAPLSIGALKHRSFKHCPYDLRMYGGYATYTKLLDPPIPGERPGGCFPGGHASGGFAWMSLYFVWFRRHRRRARRALLAAFLFGNLLGFARVVQGAHFLSHHLWTAVIAWCVALVLYEVILRRHDDALAALELSAAPA